MFTFLIDGYNLMHAAGLAHRTLKPGRFDSARRRFLDWLADSGPVRAGAARVRVVFDAQNGVANDGERTHRGTVTVRFAYKQTADDLIEHLLKAEPLAAKLAVVSNDNRLEEAARRRRVGHWPCEAFMDWLIRGTPGPGTRNPRPVPEPEKPDGPLTDAERAALLVAFGVPKGR